MKQKNPFSLLPPPLIFLRAFLGDILRYDKSLSNISLEKGNNKLLLRGGSSSPYFSVTRFNRNYYILQTECFV